VARGDAAAVEFLMAGRVRRWRDGSGFSMALMRQVFEIEADLSMTGSVRSWLTTLVGTRKQRGMVRRRLRSGSCAAFARGEVYYSVAMTPAVVRL
jgi:hypothetical protein